MTGMIIEILEKIALTLACIEGNCPKIIGVTARRQVCESPGAYSGK
jgi:hypothetical protein